MLLIIDYIKGIEDKDIFRFNIKYNRSADYFEIEYNGFRTMIVR